MVAEINVYVHFNNLSYDLRIYRKLLENLLENYIQINFNI